MQETQVRSLGQEDPLEKEMATHSSTLAWKIPWTEQPGGLQSMGSQRVGHNWATSLSKEFSVPILQFFSVFEIVSNEKILKTSTLGTHTKKCDSLVNKLYGHPVLFFSTFHPQIVSFFFSLLVFRKSLTLFFFSLHFTFNCVDVLFYSVQFILSVVSDSLQPH